MIKRKKSFATLIALLLFLTMIPVHAIAAESIKVMIHNQEVRFADAEPYEFEDHVMLPIRHIAEAIGLQVIFDQESKTVQLRHTESSLEVSFPLESDIVLVNGVAEVPIALAVAMKHNRVYVPHSFFHDVLRLDVSYEAEERMIRIQPHSSVNEIAHAMIDLFSKGQYQQLSDQFLDDQIKAQITVEALQMGWEQVSEIAGEFQAVKDVQIVTEEENYTEVGVVVAFSDHDVSLAIALGNDGKVIGMLLNLVMPEAQLPSTLIEEEVVVGEGSDYPLSGTLTMPKEAEGPLPAVVLVQGSGPSDRDESAGAYKPFLDIAWGLAQQGIAVLRYDKRTYTYANSFTPETAARITVKEETIDDAIAASLLLKADKRMDADRVYLVGHSLGGMLAPRIDLEGGDFKGLVILAGTARSLWQISHDQNAAFIAEMNDADPMKQANEEWLASELAKAEMLQEMTEEEALMTTIFGMLAFYLKEMDNHPTANHIENIDKPIFILQGEDDFQVYVDPDYHLWQELLGDRANVTFKLYPGLNHFFVNYSGEGEGTIDEYHIPGHVDTRVIEDIATWISEGGELDETNGFTN